MRIMKIDVHSFAPREQFQKIAVQVSFAEDKPEFHSSAIVDVLIDQTDSLAVMRKTAIEAAIEFLRAAVVDDAMDTSS